MVPRPGYYSVMPKRRFLGQDEYLPFITIPPDPPSIDDGGAAVLSPTLRRADADAATNVSTPSYDDGSGKVLEVHVFACPPDACEGGGKCAEGRTGPVCGVCQEGWSMSSGRCQRCGGDVSTTMGLGALVGFMIFGIVWYLVAWKVLLTTDRKSAEDEDEDGEEKETPLMKALKRFHPQPWRLNPKL